MDNRDQSEPPDLSDQWEFPEHLEDLEMTVVQDPGETTDHVDLQEKTE